MPRKPGQDEAGKLLERAKRTPEPHQTVEEVSGPSLRVQVTTYLTRDEAAALRALAAADDRSLAYVVRAAVRQYIARHSGLP